MKKFLGGIIFYACLPILDSLVEYICGFIEVKKSSNSKEIMKANKEISDIQSQLEPECTSCIGFEVPNEEEYWEEDD